MCNRLKRSSQLNGSTRWLFLQRHGNICVRRETDLVAFNASHEAGLDVVLGRTHEYARPT